MNLSLPIKTKDLEEWLPHRPPMVWIDRVTQVSESRGVAESDLVNNSLLLSIPTHLRDSAVIEFMAQGYGYVRVCQSVLGFLPPKAAAKKAFLAQVRNLEIFLPLANADRIEIHIEVLRNFSDLCLLRAIILRGRGGPVLASGELKIYSSPS